MDPPTENGHSHFGQPLVKLRKGIEAFQLPGDLVTPKKPLYSRRSERGSSSASEGISSSDCTMEYLADLIKEKRQLEIFPQFFPHTERLIDEEITRVRMVLFHCSFSIEKVDLPDPQGDPITVQKKVYVPCKEHPDYNFVGRLLGPRGMTAKQLEQETGCKIMVRGRGSMRDHRNREGTDDLKRKQLMELAIFKGTYRPVKQMRGAQLVSPLSLVSPIRQPPSSLPSRPIFVSPVGSPITSANNIGSAPAMNSFMQSPNIDYNMFMNQLSFDAAALTSLSMGNSDYQPQSSAFAATTPLMNAAVVPNPLRSYLLDSATISPPASTGSDHH